jgi:DNA-binding transcriptional ArsR family regulator
MEKTDALAAFAALSQETRLEALRLLVQAGPRGLAAGEIAAALSVRPNTLSSNLAQLRAAGLIRSTREGRSIRFFAEMAGLRGLVQFLLADCCGGRPDLCQPLIEQIDLPDCAP